MRNMLFAAALAIAAAAAGCAKSDQGAAGAKAEDIKFPTMTVDEVDRAIAANEAQAVDCNGDRTRKRLGFVPGAVLLTDEDSFPASELPADKTKKLVFYCAGPD